MAEDKFAREEHYGRITDEQLHEPDFVKRQEHFANAAKAQLSDNRVALDPKNAFEAELIKIVEMHRRKARDYAGGNHPNANFYGTARQLALTGGHAVEALLATKAERLRVMLPQFWNQTGYTPANEGIYDTLLDRAVYSIIALTIWSEDGYESQEPHQKAQGEINARR